MQSIVALWQFVYEYVCDQGELGGTNYDYISCRYTAQEHVRMHMFDRKIRLRSNAAILHCMVT